MDTSVDLLLPLQGLATEEVVHQSSGTNAAPVFEQPIVLPPAALQRLVFSSSFPQSAEILHWTMSAQDDSKRLNGIPGQQQLKTRMSYR